MADVVVPNGTPTPVPFIQPEIKNFWDATPAVHYQIRDCLYTGCLCRVLYSGFPLRTSPVF